VLTLIYTGWIDKDFNAYFLHHIFTGDIHAAPTTLATSTEVLKFVSNVQGAIGYLRTTAADESVKVCFASTVFLPCDKDYSIRMPPEGSQIIEKLQKNGLRHANSSSDFVTFVSNHP